MPKHYNKMSHTIFYAMCAIIVALLAVGCSDHEEGRDENNVCLSFVMAVDETTGTRSANENWADYDPKDSGTTDENAINPNDIHIIICDAMGKLIANVENITASKLSDTHYYVQGTWANSAENLSKAKKIMIVANAGVASVGSDFANTTYTLASTNKYIPMWGVASIASLQLGKNNDIGTIDMLRAEAKVSVRLRSDMDSKGYAIERLTINNLNAAGYCLPSSYYAVDKTCDLPFAGSLHILDSHVATRDFTTTGTTYLPEYDNTSASATPSTISVTLSRGGKTEGEYSLQFRGYDADGAPTGTPYDIQRNHYYQYTIYKSDNNINVTLHVRKWNLREHDEIIM